MAGIALGAISDRLATQRTARGQEAVTALKAQQVAAEERRKMAEQLQGAVDSQLSAASDIVSAAAAKNIGPNDPRVTSAIAPLIENARQIALEAEGAGVAGVSTSTVNSRIQGLQFATTAEEEAQRKAEAAGMETRAEAEASRDVKVETVDALTQGMPPDQRRRAFASSLGIDLEGPQGAEFIQLLDRLPNAGSEFERGQIVGRLNKLQEGRGPLITIGGVTPTIDENGNLVLQSAEGEAGVAAGTASTARDPRTRFLVTGGALDTLRGQKSIIDQAIEMVGVLEQQIENQPDRFGLAGGIKAGVENLAGMASDLAASGISLFGSDAEKAAKELREAFATEVEDEEARDMLVPPASAGSVDVFESTLTYAIARTLQPEGRLLKDTIRSAREQAQLRGMISSGRILERLGTVRNSLERRSADLTARMQRGVSGSSTTERPPISTPNPTPVENMDDEEVNRRLKEILDGG